MDVERAHEIARERGTIPVVYWIARAILQPFFHVYFRLRRIGMEHIPEGPVLLAANHRSFSDPFMIGMCLRRPLHFVAKVELFDKRWKAWILLALGAFPVRRGESDDDAMETARLILERGGAVGIFPEGTRVRPGPLGQPKRGIGRLALETGAPIVPVAISGTEDIRRGWLIRPRRVSVRCGRALTFPRPLELEPRHHGLAQEIANRVWSCVSLQWEWLGGLPPVRHAIVVGAGSWGTAVATLLARGGASVQLVCRTPEQAHDLGALRTNAAYLPGIPLPDGVAVTTLEAVDWEGADFACLALPSQTLPAALEGIGPRLPSGLGILVLSKGLVAPNGIQPTSLVLKTAGRRPVACLGGPAHAVEAVERGAALTVASPDRKFAALLSGAFRSGGVSCETSSDLVGVELASVAKNAAALAAGAALGAGPNAAGAAAGRVFAECHAFAKARGARPESLVGPAGTGDLVATVLAPHSRNRRAGELLAEGASPDRIPALLGQVPEALFVVPVLARAMDEAGIRAPATHELAALAEGRIPAEQWIARAHRAPARTRAA